MPYSRIQIHPAVKWGALGLGVFLSWGIIKPILGTLAGAATTVKDDVEAATTASSNHLALAVAKRLLQTAETIREAFHGSRFSEDEASAIAAINTCTTSAEVRSLCAIYQQKYNVSLQAEFENYTHFWNGSPNTLVTSNWY